MNLTDPNSILRLANGTLLIPPAHSAVWEEWSAIQHAAVRDLESQRQLFRTTRGQLRNLSQMVSPQLLDSGAFIMPACYLKSYSDAALDASDSGDLSDADSQHSPSAHDGSAVMIVGPSAVAAAAISSASSSSSSSATLPGASGHMLGSTSSALVTGAPPSVPFLNISPPVPAVIGEEAGERKKRRYQFLLKPPAEPPTYYFMAAEQLVRHAGSPKIRNPERLLSISQKLTVRKSSRCMSQPFRVDEHHFIMPEQNSFQAICRSRDGKAYDKLRDDGLEKDPMQPEFSDSDDDFYGSLGGAPPVASLRTVLTIHAQDPSEHDVHDDQLMIEPVSRPDETDDGPLQHGDEELEEEDVAMEEEEDISDSE